jgi:hypothetical protein
MLDAIGDVIEFLLNNGVPSPETLGKQRQARLVVGAVALAINGGLAMWLGESALRGWAILVLSGMTIAAGWALLFSIVDVAKELPSVARLSVAAGAVATAAIAVLPLLVFG